MPIRDLTVAEFRLVFPVFHRSLPYRNIRITDRVGLRNQPYTVNQGLGADAIFHLNVGAVGFLGMDGSAKFRKILVHELVHVWQGHYSGYTAAFIFGSIAARIVHGPFAYFYKLGLPWGSYDVEQQASIIEDWYSIDALNTGSPRFPYVRDNIWARTSPVPI